MKKPKPDPVKTYLAAIGRKGGQKVTEKKLESLARTRARKAKKRAARAEESK